MTRVLDMSDLHIEIGCKRRGALGVLLSRSPLDTRPLLKSVPQPDLIVLAGDIHSSVFRVAYADSLAKRFGAPVAWWRVITNGTIKLTK
ncbi:hypothetical protein [Acidocella sp.]|uniref:hypothetical protein n=1 Tax=Acidocella sp. TaxID=50710 RepID=UPI00261F1AA2|nr:hypothetical protein [Acidocella sp.]